MPIFDKDIFDKDLDLRGYTVKVRCYEAIAIPKDSARDVYTEYVVYTWSLSTPLSTSSHLSVYVNQVIVPLADKTTHDVVEVFPLGSDVSAFPHHLDLRGRTVLLRGRGNNKHPIVKIPLKAERATSSPYTQDENSDSYTCCYTWNDPYDGSPKQCYQLIGKTGRKAGCSIYDIFEVLPMVTEKPDEAPGPEPEKPEPVFSPDLDLRGRTICLHGDGVGPGPVVTIPSNAHRVRTVEEVTYSWWNGPDSVTDMCRVQQKVNSLAGPLRGDIVAVLPAEPDSEESTAASATAASATATPATPATDLKTARLGSGAVAKVSIEGRSVWVMPKDQATAANVVCLSPVSLMGLVRFAQRNGILPAQIDEVGS